MRRSERQRVVAGEVAQVRSGRDEQRVESGGGGGRLRAGETFGVEEQLGHGTNVGADDRPARRSVSDVLTRSAPAIRLAGLALGTAALLAACSGSPNKAAASAACAEPIASASSYSASVLADQKAAATAETSKDPTKVADVRADQGKLQLAWAQLITAHEKCFPDDSVAAAREYLTGPGG